MALVLLAGCMSKEDKRDALMENAKKLEESADYGKARAEARNALELDPSFAGAYLLLGRCDMKEERWSEALSNFSRAHELDPQNFEALRGLSRVSLLTEDIAKAEEYVTKALAQQPDSVDLKCIQAGIMMRRSEFGKVKELLEGLVSGNPDNEEVIIGLASAYLNTGEQERAQLLLSTSLEQKPDSSAILSLLMNLSFRQQDYPATRNYLDKLLVLHPDNENLAVQMADLLPLLDKAAEAPTYLQDYLVKHPKADAARIRLAELHMAAREPDKALQELEKAPEASPSIRLAKSTVLMQTGQREKAMELLRALGADPKGGESGNTALLVLAEIQLRQDKLDEAIASLTTLIGRTKDNLNAYVLRGQAYYNAKRYQEAMADLNIAAKGAPDDYSASLALADAQNAAGLHEQSEATIREVIQRAPSFSPAYIALANYFIVNTNPYEALAAIALGKKALPDNLDLAIAEVDILLQEKRYTEASDLLKVLVKRDDAKVAARLRLAAVHAAEKNYAAAIKIYDQMLAEDDASMVAVDGRIRMHLAAGEPDKALAFAEKRQKARPKDSTAALMAGELALVTQNPKKAEKAFLSALELTPQWDQPATRLAQIYAATKQYDQGIAAVKKILEKDRDGVAAAVLLANLQEQKGDFGGAEQSYRDMLKNDPTNLLASNNLAYLLSNNSPTPERLAEAEELAAKGAASGIPVMLDTLGWIRHLLGKKAEAEADLRKAYELDKENPAVTYHLAAALAAQGGQDKKEEAIRLLQSLANNKTPFTKQDEATKLLKSLQQ